jgi:hypothetical protein
VLESLCQGAVNCLLVCWPGRQPEGTLSRLIIHFVCTNVLTPRTAAVYGPLTTLNLYVLGMTLVGDEERTYGGFLGSVFYHAVVARDGAPFIFSALLDLRRAADDTPRSSEYTPQKKFTLLALSRLVAPSPWSWSMGTRAGLKALGTAAAARHALYDLDVLAVLVLALEA